MAYEINSDKNDGKVSEFNEAILKMARLDQLQQRLNFFNSNLLTFNPEENAYNFELLFQTLSSLYREVRPKLSKDDKVKGDVRRNGLRIFMLKHPVYKRVLNAREDVYMEKFQPKVWEVLVKELNDYENIVRDYINLVGMDTPDKADEGYF